ncbi:MAG: GH25 family lysozyme [Eubacteriales bacterium]|nr:GH25 family lysozyme [Eubacteriales bacterium]
MKTKQTHMKKIQKQGRKQLLSAVLLALCCIFWLGMTANAWGIGSRGLDLSEHNGNVDFVRLKTDGIIDFAVLRLGFGTENIGTHPGRGVYNDDIYMDLKLEQFQKEATAAGLPILGYYLYAYGENAEQGLGEAEHAIKLLERIGAVKGSYVIYDVEQYQDPDEEEKIGINDAAQAFLQRVEQAGFRPMLYCSYSYYYDVMDGTRMDRYDKWIAHYMDTEKGEIINDPQTLLERGYNQYSYDKIMQVPGIKLWQYSESGIFPGSGGHVDVNVIVGDIGIAPTPNGEDPTDDGDLAQVQKTISAAMRANRYRSDGHSIIANVAPQDDLKTELEQALPGAVIEVEQKNGQQLSTGDSLHITYLGKQTQWSVSVLGDTDGSGQCNIFDVGQMVRHILKKQELSNVQLQAADINADGQVNIFDVGSVVRHIRRIKLFY